MKNFTCSCGQTIYFGNNHCLGCGEPVAYEPVGGRMLAGSFDGYKLCDNGERYGVCNWLLPADDANTLCRSCRTTRTTPNLSSDQNIRRWGILESAKRRLLYSLMYFDLPIDADPQHGHPALAFDFLEDRSSNPLVAEDYIRTGHAIGVITINISEADDVQREITRSLMNESYRTPLGHCRHESGHYYYDRLIRGTDLEAEFRALFGDPNSDYEAALANYYEHLQLHDSAAGYISLYAQSHPLEDWAECWAHYLHIHDTLETAIEAGVVAVEKTDSGPDGWVYDWLRLAVILNELNLSMGLANAYPFVLTPRIIEKLRFMHSVVTRSSPS